jgi:hypothetical protein
MTPLRHLILPHIKPGRAVAEATRRAEICEFDQRIIRNAREALQRSRELLEETKHQVRTPGQ